MADDTIKLIGEISENVPLQGGVQYNETLDQAIQDQIENPKYPRYVVTLKGKSGSFKVPKNARITVLDGNDCTLEDNEGHNEVHFSNCESVTIKGFKNGSLRLDGCKQVKELTVGDAVKVTVGSAKIDKIDIGKSELTMMVCEVDKFTSNGARLTSLKNTFKSDCTITGGQLYSEEDEFKADSSIKDNAIVNLIGVTSKGDLTIDNAYVTLQEPKDVQKIIVKSGRCIVNGGKVKEIS